MALETYTASGRISGGPVAAAPDPGAMARPYAALAAAGETTTATAGVLSQLAERKQKEKDLTWATENLTAASRKIIERRAEDDKNPTETQGEDFLKFGNELVSEMSKNAPSAKAARLFKEHADGFVTRTYDDALRAGERTRLINADTANLRSAANIVETYKLTADLDSPDGAARDIAPLVRVQMASIEERFGKSAPALARRMKETLAEEIAFGTAATNPVFARQFVKGAPISEEKRVALYSRIDTIENSAMAFERWRFGKDLDETLKVAAITGDIVPEIKPESFKSRFGEHWQIAYQGFEDHRQLVNTANQTFAEVASYNSSEQARRIVDISVNGTADQKQAIPEMVQRQKAAAALQLKDPVSWQMQHDPDVQANFALVDGAPDNMKPQATAAAYYHMMERQGMPPEDAPNPKQYLGHAKAHILTAAQADERKRAINAAGIDDKLHFLSQLETEFGNTELANVAYSDMLELGDEKLSVAFRFAGTITDLNTRKDFVAAQSAAKADKKLDEQKAREYLDVLDNSKDWEHFQMGWLGEALEGTTDAADAKQALLAYAQSLVVKHGMKPADAMKTAVQRVISDNYGFADVHSHIIPIARHRPNGGLKRTDEDIAGIQRGLRNSLFNVPVAELALENPITKQPYFPTLSPSFDQKKETDQQVLRNLVSATGFWSTSQDGESVTLMSAEPQTGGFALLNKNGETFTLRLDDIPLVPETARERYVDSLTRALGRPPTAKELRGAPLTPDATGAVLNLSPELTERLTGNRPGPQWPRRADYFKTVDRLQRNFKVD